jgi:hypothetical protein
LPADESVAIAAALGSAPIRPGARKAFDISALHAAAMDDAELACPSANIQARPNTKRPHLLSKVVIGPPRLQGCLAPFSESPDSRHLVPISRPRHLVARVSAWVKLDGTDGVPPLGH